MRVERPRAPERPETPHIPQQLFLREHACRVRHQLQEQLVLLACQRYGRAVDADGPGCEVGRDRPRAQDLVSGGRCSPQHRPDPRQQLLVVERPREEVVATAF
jgi:hypothetical protein